MSGMPGAVAARRIQWELRTLAGPSPALCRVLLRGGELATPETEICIEGFQRSGNTFAVIAFQRAQPRTVSIAHHVHAPGAVIAALRVGKPVLVLVRDPADAVVSTVLRYPHLTMRQALRGWVRFYRPLLRYRDRMVSGSFPEVVADLGSVIRRVNERFETRFREFEPTEANVAEVLAELDRWDLNTFGGGEQLELGRARPTATRAKAKAEIAARYEAPSLARLREAARRLHDSFAPGAG